MSSRYGFLGFFLVCIVLLLAYKNYEIWSHPFEWAAKKEAMKKPEAKTENLATDGPREPSSHESTLVIAEKNIFSPDRKEFPLLSVDQAKPVVRAHPEVCKPQALPNGFQMKMCLLVGATGDITRSCG